MNKDSDSFSNNKSFKKVSILVLALMVIPVVAVISFKDNAMENGTIVPEKVEETWGDIELPPSVNEAGEELKEIID